MSPFPNTAVIPPLWAEKHRPVAAQTMVSVCRIYRASGPPPFPEPPGWTGEELIWTGTSRLQALKRENTVDAAGQDTELREYSVGLPFENREGITLPELRTGERGDVVDILGRRFTLKQSTAGSTLWQNDFIATENQTQQNP